MNTNTILKPLNHLELLRKYKTFLSIPSEELKAAQVHLSGRNALAVLHEAARAYETEVREESNRTGSHPAVCFNKDGHCEDDHCRCWK